MSPEDIAADRASIATFRSELGAVSYMVRGKVSNALDRWEIALNAVEKLEGVTPTNPPA